MKKLLTLMLFVFLLGFLVSCSDQSDCCTNNDLNIEVELQHVDGTDMLNPSTAGHIPKQDIEVFYEIEGKFETYASLNEGASLDNPEGFDVQSDGTKYYLHVFSNPTAGDHVVTLIMIKDRSEIRLITKVADDHGKQIKELWFNDQLVWSTPASQSSPRVTVKID